MQVRQAVFPFSLMRRLYDWVLSFSQTPHGAAALFVIAFVEASFFPIPPDVLLIALAIGIPRRSLWFATVCTAGSVVGAGFGYLIGWQFFELLGKPIITFYSAGERYMQVRLLYEEWDAIAIIVAGLSPIPFKVFTIAAGVFQINFLTFMLASLFSRGLRFYVIGALVFRYGPPIKIFIERYFNWLATAFVILLVAGFLVLKYVI